MKTNKYTTVALALIAAASIATSAQAAGTGDIILGIYDANTAGSPVTQSYEVDLGSYTSLTANESFNLGSTISTLFSSDASAQLVFDIAGAGGSLSAGGGLLKKQVVMTASTLPSLPASGGNTTPVGNIASEYGTFGTAAGTNVTSGNSSNGTAFSVFQVANATSGSFQNAISNNSGSYGFGGGNPSVVLSPYSSSASANFFSVLNSNSQETAAGTTKDPTDYPSGDLFQFSATGSGVTLTFDPTATPEPSAYALGLCAAALFWVLQRRRSVV